MNAIQKAKQAGKDFYAAQFAARRPLDWTSAAAIQEFIETAARCEAENLFSTRNEGTAFFQGIKEAHRAEVAEYDDAMLEQDIAEHEAAANAYGFSYLYG